VYRLAYNSLVAAELANALRCRPSVSVCTFLKRAKRGRFAYSALKFMPIINKMRYLTVVVMCLGGLCIVERAISQGAANYRLTPNDLLDFRVFDEPDLTAEVRLAADGTAIFPLIGSVSLRDKTIPQATALLRERYMAGYLVNPQVSLIIHTYAKRSFTVFGQVQKPGSYEIVGDEAISLLQAVGMAGGYTRIADPGKITVRRTEGGQEQVMRFNGRRIAKGDSAPDCVVKPGDVITVGESIF
jgi:protein involved in polysaccharide export with SLBB domain